MNNETAGRHEESPHLQCGEDVNAEPFLNAIAGLFGDQLVGGLTMATAVRSLTSPPLPAGWDSPAAQGLQEHLQLLDTNTGSFADRDDDLKTRLDVAAQAVADGKARLRQIRADYRTNSARLASNSPETAARQAELDRSTIQAAVDTVHATQNRLPTLPAYQANATRFSQLVLGPPVGFIIWCMPSTLTTGFICEFLQSDGSIIWRHSPIDITGGMP